MRPLLLAAAASLACGFAAHADTIRDFTFNSTLTSGYTTSGTVSVNVTTGTVVKSNFTLYNSGVTTALFTVPDYSQPTNGAYLAEFQGSVSGYTFELLLPNASLVNYAGGSVCTTSSTCLGGYPAGVYLPRGGSASVTSGSLATVITPEPSSVALLGTGAVGAAAVMRRRFRQA